MIKVTRLNHEAYYVNAEMIVFVEATPDTVISLINDKKIVVLENIEQIIQRIIEYKRETLKLITIKQ